MLTALPAFWVGLLYDTSALDAAWDLVRGWSAQERQALRDAVPKQGLAATVAGRPLHEVAAEVLELSRAAARRARADGAGRRECLPAPLHEIVARRRSLAQDLEERFRSAWNGKVEPVMTELAL
ncbi:Glutamate--cysteine ligase OS=Bosea thiooxidans OX=53254 GN=ARD30_21985 PE=3 SV=1 [Bosea thiooxidans]